VSEDRDQYDAAAGDGQTDMSDAEEAPRMRFKGIVEAKSHETSPAGSEYAVGPIFRNEQRWNAMSRQVWLASRLTALLLPCVFLVGMPLGSWIAHFELNGSLDGWVWWRAYQSSSLVFAIIIPVLVGLMGYMLSRSLTMMSAAESIAAAAQRFVTPDLTAAQNVSSVGAVVQGHLHDLNEGLDGALTRLATVEAMIRQHVEAIEVAGEAIEHKATGAVTRVADERARLMELTENLNAHADSFAAAIAEKAKNSIESIQSADAVSLRAEQEFDERLTRLEGAAANALSSFEALRDALRATDETMRASAGSINEAASQTMEATDRISTSAKAAAEAAAREAANVAASMDQTAQAAREAADATIEKNKEQVARISDAAVETTVRETSKVHDASKQAVDTAAADAAKVTKAATDVSEAARHTGEVVAKASADISAVTESARKAADDAVKHSKAHAGQVEQRAQALVEARTALEKENARLETLIEEQRSRANRLADAISSQTDRLSRLAEAQLSEQEAAARLTQAQIGMQAEADRQAAERKRTETRVAEQKRAADTKTVRHAEDAAKKESAEKEDAKKKAPAAQAAPQPTLNLVEASRTKPAQVKKAPEANGGERLDELARDIAERRPRGAGSRRKEPPVTKAAAPEEEIRRHKGDVSWREILDAADDAEPLELGPAAKKSPTEARSAEENAIKIISRLQLFTHDLEIKLYGDPPPALQERFERGDRNVFANRLLRLNEADVKRRIRTESGRNKDFEIGIHNYLQGFEKLLEDATTSDTADEELEEYLSSPLGRVYLLIGATVGYFA